MSLRPQLIPAIPEESARIAKLAFPNGNLFLQIRDEIGVLWQDESFAALFPTRGQPAASPWRLALITIFQFIEGLSDRQAAEAVRARIDWKYALSLELTDCGFDSSVLCEFRSRLLDGQAESLLFDALLGWCKEKKFLKARGRQRTDSTHVLASIHALNRLQCVIETLRHALNVLALVEPQWLRSISHADWVERYAPRAPDVKVPSGADQRKEFAELIGQDGCQLLEAIDSPNAPQWLKEIAAAQTLRRVWLQQYYLDSEGLHWRTQKEGTPPASRFISSPYDLDAHYGKKRATTWIGYKVYLTESCDDDTPHLITNVQTTSAPVSDGAVTPVIHVALEEKELLPETHLADTGFVDAELLVESQQQYGVNLLGPTRDNYHYKTRSADRFSVSNFKIDWQNQTAICPEGKQSLSWSPIRKKSGKESIKIKFSRKDCKVCPSHEQCTKAKRIRRAISILPREQHEALQAARERERTEEYRQEYQRRAGVEGTISQGVRGFGMRRSRYIGLAKTHLQHVLTATAMNVVRLIEWLDGKEMAQTRQTSFVRLMAFASG